MGVLNERLFTITFGWKHSPYLKKKWNVSCTFQYFKISMGTYKYIWISITSGILSTKYYLLCIYFFSWTMHPDKYSGLIAFLLCTHKHIFVDMKYNSAGYLSFLVCVTSLFYEIIVHQKSWKNNIWPFYT